MQESKTTFALFYGNRGFFPASIIADARTELPRALKSLGHDSIALDAAATRHGAVETPVEGERYARFLRENRGKFDGVILCLPNFGDETGAVAALKDCGVPVLIQAYPDEMGRMSPELRRDSFCGKISIMDVFTQYGVKFTALAPHVVAPAIEAFAENVRYFDSVCRVVGGMRGTVIGSIGARTTPFKTVRIDEVALQRHGITVETMDLAEVIKRVGSVRSSAGAFKAKAETLRAYTSWEGVPEQAFERIARLGVVLDEIVAEQRLDALALRCWTELQMQLGISPCVLMGEMNGRGVAAACEVDVGSAVAMRAISLASGQPAACLDWNNNYAEDPDKCILFHCGPVPRELMEGQGRITDHLILQSSVGKGCGFGCNVGRIKRGGVTFGNMLTDSGELRFYLGEGEFTGEPIPQDYFGCAGVIDIPGLQDLLLFMGKNGHRHHVGVTPGAVMLPLREALGNYLGCDVALPQGEKV
jgi:L-fucose isomerase-like protein